MWLPRRWRILHALLPNHMPSSRVTVEWLIMSAFGHISTEGGIIRRWLVMSAFRHISTLFMRWFGSDDRVRFEESVASLLALLAQLPNSWKCPILRWTRTRYPWSCIRSPALSTCMVGEKLEAGTRNLWATTTSVPGCGIDCLAIANSGHSR
jgi:hypothetical protein